MVATSMPRPRPRTNLRWLIGLLLGLGILVNYFDRANLSVARPAWLPSFLVETQRWDILKSGLHATIPWLVATITDLVIGAWLVDYLIAKGYEPKRAPIVTGYIVVGILAYIFLLGRIEPTPDPV